MIKQIKRSDLTIALVIVVALSAVLSASVWINPFHYERALGTARVPRRAKTPFNP